MTEELIPSDAVQAIKDSVLTAPIRCLDDHYLTRAVYLPPAEPTPRTLTIHTLTGVLDYARHDSEENIMIHVLNPTTVEILGELKGRHRQRDRYLTADCRPVIGDGFKFGQFQSLEQFIINLQAQFVPTEEREKVLRVAGNVKEENVRQASDDGVTQSVIARTGITQVENVEVPNPVELQPYRTFPEIDQPVSHFVLRMRQGREGSLPEVALFEADGGAWKLDAIEQIKEWLKLHLGDEFTIIA